MFNRIEINFLTKIIEKCDSYLFRNITFFTFIFLFATELSFGNDPDDAVEFSKIKTPDGQIYVMKNFKSTREVLDSYWPILSKRGNKKAMFFWYYVKQRNIMLYPHAFEEGERNLKLMTDFAKKHDLEVAYQITEYINTNNLRANNKIDIQQHYSKFLEILETMRKIGFQHFFDFDLEILMYDFGLLFYEIGDYDKALLALKEGEKYKVYSINSIYQTLNLNLIENIYAIQKNYDKAIAYAQKNYELNRSFNPNLDPKEWRSVFWQGFSILSTADYKLKQGKFHEAEKLALEGYKIVSLNKSNGEEAQIWAEFEAIQLLLKIKLKLNKLQDAKSLVERSEEIVRKLKLEPENEDFRLIKFYINLSDFYEKKGYSQKSLVYLKNGRRLEILKEEQNDKRNLWRIEMRVKSEQYQANIAKVEKARKQQTMLTYAIVALFVLGFIAAFLIYRRISEKNRTIALQKDDLQKSLLEKETLLREIHHRVKNNLQIINGLLEKQGQKTDSQAFRDLIKESQDRIYSMVLIHQNIYQTENIDDVEIQTYLSMLCENLSNTYKSDKDVAIDIQSDKFMMNIDIAIPLGLIINELISNCFKHAFGSANDPRIEIILKKVELGFYLLVKDNGMGMPLHFNLEQSKTLGMNLVKGLVRQINGKLNFKSSQQGTVFEITT